MKSILLSILIFCLCAACGEASEKVIVSSIDQLLPKVQASHQMRASSVVINNVRLSIENVQEIEQQYKLKIWDGNYWYDNSSGAWGYQGGPMMGFVTAGLNLGGPILPNASNGKTGIIVNGRELPREDLFTIESIVGELAKGNYWLDAFGNIGQENQVAIANLNDFPDKAKSIDKMLYKGYANMNIQEEIQQIGLLVSSK